MEEKPEALVETNMQLTGIIVENNLFKLRLGYFAKKADAEACYKVLISNGFEAFFGIVERN